MNLQTLKYFVSLAKTKNYTKAAEECFVSQPALSRSISEFENRLGCQLVIRNSRSVELTEEGEACLIEAKKIIKQCNELVINVSNINRQFTRPVKIGYIIYGHIVVFNKILSKLPKNNIKIETEYDTLPNCKKKLISNEIDMSIVPRICLENNDNFKSFNIQSSKLYVLVHSNNKLFNQDFVKFVDLKNQNFIGWDKDEVPLLSDAHFKICEKHGIKPNFSAYGKKMGDVMTLCILHNAIGFAGRNTTIVDSKEFKLLPVEDSEEEYGLVCIWNNNNTNPSVNKLVKMFRS